MPAVHEVEREAAPGVSDEDHHCAGHSKALSEAEGQEAEDVCEVHATQGEEEGDVSPEHPGQEKEEATKPVQTFQREEAEVVQAVHEDERAEEEKMSGKTDGEKEEEEECMPTKNLLERREMFPKRKELQVSLLSFLLLCLSFAALGEPKSRQRWPLSIAMATLQNVLYLRCTCRDQRVESLTPVRVSFDALSFRCKCRRGFKGRRCERRQQKKRPPKKKRRPNPCKKNPCINGGRCMVRGKTFRFVWSACVQVGSFSQNHT